MTEEQIQATAVACSRGQLEGFGALYDAFLDRIYRFAYYRTGHQQLAEDITGEVFMKALRSISGYKPERASFTTWLYAIARNAVIDHSRTQRPTEGLESIVELAASDDPARTVHSRLQLAQVMEQLKAYTPRQQDIVLMRLWDGMSHKEIAEVLGMSEASVKMQFSRTVKQLQHKLGVTAVVALAAAWTGVQAGRI